MPLERLRFLFLGLGAIVLTAGGAWMAFAATTSADRLWGAFGALFFGVGIWVTFRAAFKGESRPARKGPASRYQPLIVPLVLVFMLPWSLKLWFCVPLLVAWGVLVPQYRDRRALLAAAGFAAALAIAQALLFCVALVPAMQEARGLGNAALPAVFLLIVLWLDGRVLWEARSRLRVGAAPAA
jgi:hypothetical protein